MPEAVQTDLVPAGGDSAHELGVVACDLPDDEDGRGDAARLYELQEAMAHSREPRLLRGGAAAVLEIERDSQGHGLVSPPRSLAMARSTAAGDDTSKARRRTGRLGDGARVMSPPPAGRGRA